MKITIRILITIILGFLFSLSLTKIQHDGFVPIEGDICDMSTSIIRKDYGWPLKIYETLTYTKDNDSCYQTAGTTDIKWNEINIVNSFFFYGFILWIIWLIAEWTTTLIPKQADISQR